MNTTAYSVRYALRRFSGIEVVSTPHAVALVGIGATGAEGKDKAHRIRRRLVQAGIRSRLTGITRDGVDIYSVVVDE